MNPTINECLCKLVCKTANALRVHRQNCKYIKSGGKCEECQAGPFASAAELLKHRNVCIRTCIKCNQYFKRPSAKKRHEKVHQVAQIGSFSGSCDKCEMIFTSKLRLAKHVMGCVHDRNPIKYLEFVSYKDVEKWIEKVQIQTRTYFSIRGGTVSSNEINYSYRYCQHNQGRSTTITPPTVRKTDRKRNCGLVPDYSCHAKIAIYDNNKEYHVKYFSRHNHLCNEEHLKFQPFPKSLKDKVLTKLLMGINTKKIYDDEQTEKWSRENRADAVIDKNDDFNRRYVNQKKSKLKSTEYRHPDDATSTSILINELSQERYNPVLLYKPCQKDVVIGNHAVLSKHANYHDIFCVGLQTKEQVDKMREHGPKILCADATHGLTAYGYQLFSLVVKDDTGKGYTVASLITSNVDKLILSHFLQLILERNPDIKISVTMSDDDDATKGAFKAAFGANITTLLCQWHVPRAWKTNLHRIPDKEERKEILFLLTSAMRTKSEDEYNRTVYVIVNDYAHCQDFVAYLTTYYFNRPEQWACCFRNFFHDHVDTNMLLESLHNLIKTRELLRLQNRRVDSLADLLLKMEIQRFKDYRALKAKNTNPPIIAITKRHYNGLKLRDDSVTRISSDEWSVESATEKGKYYKVVMRVDVCVASHCYISCPATACDDLCVHLFACSCVDMDPLCKHIHKVQAKRLRNMITRVQAKVAAAPTSPTLPVLAKTVQIPCPTTQSINPAPPPISPILSDSEDDEDIEIKVELASRMKEKMVEIAKLLDDGVFLNLPKSFALASEKKLAQCLQLMKTRTLTKKELSKLQVVGKTPPLIPNGRLERQPSFKKKTKLGVKTSSSLSKAPTKTGLALPPSAGITTTPQTVVQAMTTPAAFKKTPLVPIQAQSSFAKKIPASVSKAPIKTGVALPKVPVIIVRANSVPTVIMSAPPTSKASNAPTKTGLASPPSAGITTTPQTVVQAMTTPAAFKQTPLVPIQARSSFANKIPASVSKVQTRAPSSTSAAKFAFLPTPPRHTGQLYGNLNPSTNVSKTLLEINGHSLNHRALKSLESEPSASDQNLFLLDGGLFTPGWLLDCVLDAFISIICEEEPEFHPMACSEVQGLSFLRKTPVRPTTNAASRLRKGVKKIFMPYNTGNHWTLLILDLNKGHFTHLDPSKSSTPEKPTAPAKPIMNQIQECLLAWWAIPCNPDDVRTVRCAKMNDGKSCGIFVLHYAELCIKGLPYETPCEPKKYRSKVFQSFMRHSANTIL